MLSHTYFDNCFIYRGLAKLHVKVYFKCHSDMSDSFEELVILHLDTHIDMYVFGWISQSYN